MAWLRRQFKVAARRRGGVVTNRELEEASAFVAWRARLVEIADLLRLVCQDGPARFSGQAGDRRWPTSGRPTCAQDFLFGANRHALDYRSFKEQGWRAGFLRYRDGYPGHEAVAQVYRDDRLIGSACLPMLHHLFVYWGTRERFCSGWEVESLLNGKLDLMLWRLQELLRQGA